MSRISPCLWFSSEAEEAAKFYVSLLPDSRIEKIQRNTVDSPGGKAGTVGSIGQRRESTVPAIEHYAHESGQVSLCPRYGLRTDLLCAQVQSRRTTATNQPDGQISQNLSSPWRKNILLSFSPKSTA